MAVPLRWPLVVPLVAIVYDVFVRRGHLIATSVMRMDREERKRKRFRGGRRREKVVVDSGAVLGK